MFRNKSKLSSSNRLKSSSLLTLNEIEALEKSSDWRKNFSVKPKEIGRGHFSKVFQVSCENRQKSFAAKVIRRRKGGIDRLEKIKQEATLIRKLNDLGVQSVIQLFETYENFSDVVLISELAKGGSLFKLVQESDAGLEPDYVKVITHKLLLALEAMHQENIVHLDIKADNILLREPYPSTDIALCDFGLATQLKDGKIYKELVGTPDYMAPEVINYEKVSVNADMWSVGVLVYNLLTGISPFMGKSKDETLFNVSKVNLSFGVIFDEPEYEDPKDFISSLCIRSPELRLTSSTSQKHRWFSDVEEIDLRFTSSNSDTKTPSKIFNGFHASEEEEDIENSEIVNLSRWQSVDFQNLKMSSKASLYRTNRPASLSTSAYENYNEDYPSKKLTHVEEVTDEQIADSEAGKRRGSRASIVDIPESVLKKPRRSTDSGDSRAHLVTVVTCSRSSSKKEVKVEDSNPRKDESDCDDIIIETSAGKGILIETVKETNGIQGNDPNVDAYLNISTCDQIDNCRKDSVVKKTFNKSLSTESFAESSSESSSRGCDNTCPQRSPDRCVLL